MKKIINILDAVLKNALVFLMVALVFAEVLRQGIVLVEDQKYTI